MMEELSDVDCKELALKIKDQFFKPVTSYKTSIFLCGADINKTDKTRFKVSEAFSDWMYSYQYDLVFPEDIFDELLYSAHGKDLLSLENLLAESIDVILIIPESPGSFAELGAFANDNNLCKKIVCLVDEKYRKDRSFINKGPVKLVKNANKLGVVYIDPLNLGKDIRKVHTAIREVKKNLSMIPKSNNINLLQLDNFLLPTIFLLEPVNKDTMIKFVQQVNDDSANSYQITTTVLTILTKKKFVELTPNGYKLTKLGIDSYFNLRRLGSRAKNHSRTIAFDDLRLEILNLKLRNKSLKK